MRLGNDLNHSITWTSLLRYDVYPLSLDEKFKNYRVPTYRGKMNFLEREDTVSDFVQFQLSEADHHLDLSYRVHIERALGRMNAFR